jgi:predicted metal-dependent hydrolase
VTVRPGASPQKRAEVLYEWHKALLRDAVTALVAQWEPTLGVQVERVFLQRMKTRWGGCNHRARNIRLNTEFVTKPRDLLEYVVVHEMPHLIEPTHNEQFVSFLDQHLPA